MKNFSLIFLMCFSIGLEAGNAVGANAAAAQAYANSSAANINTASSNLASLSEQLNGVNLAPGLWTQGLLSSLETSLCGANVNLDAQGNVTTGGLLIDATGNYTNCTGGAVPIYNSWSSGVSCWQQYIQNLTIHKDWQQAYDACATNIGTVTNANLPAGCNLSGDFYTSLDALNAQANALFSAITDVIGCDAVAATDTAPAIAAKPNQLNILNSYVTQMNEAFTALFNFMNCKDPESTVNQIISLGSNIANVLKPANTSSYEAYVACYNNFRLGGQKETCAVGQLGAANFVPAPCSQELQAYFNNWTQFTAATEQVMNLLLDYQPYDTVVYGQQNIIPSAAIQCILPNLCTGDPSNVNNCSYSLPKLTVDTETYFNNMTAALNNILSLSKTYDPIIKSANSRITAILNQVNLLSKNIETMTDPSTGKIQAIFAQCQKDTDKYIAELKKQQVLLTIFSSVIGNILGMVMISLSGGIGISLLPELLMAVTMIPQVNSATIGALTQILSQDLANKIEPIQ